MIHHQATDPPRATVVSRLCRIVRKRMSVEEIETAYVSKWGTVSHKRIVNELSELFLGGVIHRIKQGVYEP